MATEGIFNFIQVSDRIGTGGQPTREQLEAARDEGYQAVINLAPSDAENFALADEEHVVTDLGLIYHHIPVAWTDPRPEQFAAFCAAMQQVGDRKVLIHCAAGKDRTGILAALTHHLAGVSEEDIVADFLLTNDIHRFERRAPQFAAHIEEMTGRLPSREAMITAMGVEAQYLETAFAAIHERHTTLDAYLEDVLGVDAARREAIAHRILD